MYYEFWFGAQFKCSKSRLITVNKDLSDFFSCAIIFCFGGASCDSEESSVV